MALVESDLFSSVQHCDQRSGDAQFHDFTDKGMRNTVESSVELDVVVDDLPWPFSIGRTHKA